MVATLCGAALSAIGGTARGYCRALTIAPPSGYDPQTDGCFAPLGDVHPLYWKNQCVGYSLQKDASKQVNLAQATRIAAQAFDAWSLAACSDGGTPSITGIDDGPVECDQVEFNPGQANQHVIVFRDHGWPHDDSANTLAYTTLRADLSTGEIVDADMEINSTDYTLMVDGPPAQGAYDLLSVMTHEAGHFLGLAHTTESTAVMFAHYHPGSTTLTNDDVAGICAVAPADGTRTTSAGSIAADLCNPTPIHGFSTLCASGQPDAGLAQDLAMPPLMPCRSIFACAISRSRSTGCLGFVGTTLAGVFVLARRFTRRMRLRRTRLRAWGTLVVLFVVHALTARDAHASVSIAVRFDELVDGATAVATVTPIEKRSVWEQGRIATYTRVHVDDIAVGEIPELLWVRTIGGAVGKIGEIVEGEASFTIGTPSFVFLRPRRDPLTRESLPGYVVVERAQGQYAIVIGADGQPRLVEVENVGMLLAPTLARNPRVAHTQGASEFQRLARDVLREHRLSDAIREIQGAWLRIHPR